MGILAESDAVYTPLSYHNGDAPLYAQETSESEPPTIWFLQRDKFTSAFEYLNTTLHETRNTLTDYVYGCIQGAIDNLLISFKDTNGTFVPTVDKFEVDGVDIIIMETPYRFWKTAVREKIKTLGDDETDDFLASRHLVTLQNLKEFYELKWEERDEKNPFSEFNFSQFT